MKQESSLIQKTGFRNRWIVRYGLAVIAVTVAFALRLALSDILGSTVAFITFYPAVMIAAVLGGLGPGLLATALTLLAVDYWVLPPVGLLTVTNTADAVAMVIFSITGTFMSVVAELYHRMRWKAAEYETDLALRESEKQTAEAMKITLQELDARAADLEEANEKLVAANEELAASNEEIAAANEELRVTTEELNEEIAERRRAEEEIRSMTLFPDENPNPVMRVSADGMLLYHNNASEALLQYWDDNPKPCVPENLLTTADDALNSGSVKELDIECQGRTFSFVLAPITNQGYVNLYGRDITIRVQAEEALCEMEAHKREFYQRTILAATEGKLIITERQDILEFACDLINSWHIEDNDAFGKMRDEVSQLALASGMEEARVYQFLGCVVEAAGNAIKHASGGEARLCRDEDALIFTMSDTGLGIGALALPDVALTRHYSTAGTLGMGYKLMIKFADRVYLATGPEGTTVAIEMRL